MDHALPSTVTSYLKIETLCFSETLVSACEFTRRHNPEEQHRCSLPCSQDPATTPFIEPDESYQTFTPTYLRTILHYFPSVLHLGPPKWSLPFRFSKSLYVFLICPIRITRP
jgi:hypothetical protein